MTPRRKPPWLKLLCPPGVNPAHLTARRCGACREWVAVDTGGPIEEVYDPGVLDATDLATAINPGPQVYAHPSHRRHHADWTAHTMRHAGHQT